MTFEEAIKQTPDVATGYKDGLQALQQSSKKITVSNTRLLNGSVDIDSCTKQNYPNNNRWDYAFSYNSFIYFVEVHPAHTSEIDTMINKLQWLKQWLKQKAPKINQLPKAQPAYYWIQSGKVSILPIAPQYRKMIEMGLKPIKNLSLS